MIGVTSTGYWDDDVNPKQRIGRFFLVSPYLKWIDSHIGARRCGKKSFATIFKFSRIKSIIFGLLIIATCIAFYFALMQYRFVPRPVSLFRFVCCLKKRNFCYLIVFNTHLFTGPLCVPDLHRIPICVRLKTLASGKVD